MKWIIACIAVAYGAAVCAGEDRAGVDARLEEVRARMASISRISGRFTQEKRLPFLKEPVVSNGRFYFSKPGSLVWEYVSPAPSGIRIDNGKTTLWSGPPGDRKPQPAAMAKAAGTMAGQVMLWMNFNPDEILAVYAVTVAADAPLTLVVVPRREAMRRFLKSIQVVLDDDLRTVRTVTIEEEEGVTALTFTDVVFDQEAPPDMPP